MILAVAATQMESGPLLAKMTEADAAARTLIVGVGPLESAVRLGRFVAENRTEISAILLYGVGGAYLAPEPVMQPPLLGLCLAEREVMGDLGICLPPGIDSFPDHLGGPTEFSLASPLLATAKKILHAHGQQYFSGTFVTVNSASGTASRGEALRARWQGVCENMEGAAVARVCLEYNLPLLEIRAISNLVEDRNPRNWRLQQACNRAAEAAALLIEEFK